MKTVGIRNLKNSLSQYITLAKAGEKIYITEHDKIVAEIIPSAGEKLESSILEEYLAEQAGKGSIQRSQRKIHLNKRKKTTRARNKELEKIYDETRSERM